MRVRFERGYMLTMVVMAAVICAIVSYALLVTSIAQARQGRLYKTRAPAVDAAEAALVWAQAQLLADPVWWSAQGGAPDVIINGLDVDIIMPQCTLNPCESRQLQAQVIY